MIEPSPPSATMPAPKPSTTSHRPPKPTSAAFRQALAPACARPPRPDPVRPVTEPDETPRRAARRREHDEEPPLAPFVVGPSVLLPPRTQVAPPTASAAPTRAAELEALLERYVRGLRVGRVGAAHEVHLRLADDAAGAPVEVRLRLEGGRVRCAIHADPRDPDVDAFGARVTRELAARGLDVDVEVRGA